MNNYLGLLIVLFSLTTVTAKEDVTDQVRQLLQAETLQRADAALESVPVTVTATRAERSAGGMHDFYSEGDYWWANPQDPNGPFIRRDGETNPDNFTAHRHAMIRFSQLVGDLTSAWILTGDKKYADAAMRHIRAWFVDQKTMMNPNLLYAQAIKGIATGRGIGIIDTIHLIEVIQSLRLMEARGIIEEKELKTIRLWFSDYLTWMSTHRYGINEMEAKNNHGTCWAMQAAAFALFTQNEEMIRFCRERYRTVLLPNQMAVDGSFPLELERTKPYGYSLFNLDAMTTLCHLLTTPEENLWEYTTTDGRNIEKGIAWLFPFVKDKSAWKRQPDIMFWEEWPVAHPFLLFGSMHHYRKDYFQTWKKLEHFPTNEEVIRNLPIRHPLLWLN
ncbi:alginate lyase family protein [Bacteroides sp. GM023]|uniref:alginate lyase family protein n=1 Tax=Bacteroides sp. GM023 TaxID=2723058 RepID=UPI00168B1188|nr:alginate lyase family protein [Bacteroides sp. GM023]MBD3590153.1 alginate lyase family protein [Bacteroides sp. GM023]